jgi:membrane protein
VSFLHDVWFVLLAFLLLLATNLAIWAISFAHHIAEMVPAFQALSLPAFDKTVPTTVVITMTGLMFYIVYGHITDSRPPTAAAIVSTITMTVLWLISGKLFGLYLSSYSTIGTVYGPYAFLLVFLLWLYFSSIIFVFGGVVGEVYWETLKQSPERYIEGA